MPRPKNPVESIKITVTASPRLRDYLNDLVAQEGYGATPSEVAKNLVWRGIEDLIYKGVLSRRAGSAGTNRSVSHD
jgi:hypothetical protein